VYAALGDFWLDEIISWMMIFRPEPVEAWWEILLIRQETNQFLSTWILYLFGPEVPWTFYRFPAVLAGAGTVVMAGLICRRGGRLETLTAMLLVGASYSLIHYSSEARGYSYVVFFSFLSLFLADRSLASPRLRWDLLFSICATLGFLAQLLYLYCFVSIAAWAVWRMWREGRTWRAIAIKAVRCCTLPVVFTTLLYVVTIRHMQGVGGPILPLGKVIVATLSLTAGGPRAGVMPFAVALLFGLALVGGLWLLRKERSDLVGILRLRRLRCSASVDPRREPRGRVSALLPHLRGVPAVAAQPRSRRSYSHQTVRKTAVCTLGGGLPGRQHD